MPPLALLPNQPAGTPDYYGGSSSGNGSQPSGHTINGVPVTAAQWELAIQQNRDDLDREYNQKKNEIDNNYRVAMMNAKTSRDVAKANRDYQNAQTALARDRLEFDRQTQSQEFGLKQATLGYNVQNMLAQLRGPADYFQAANFARGVANTPGTSSFLTALQQNARMPDYGAQQGIPQAETGSTLAAKLNGTFQAGTGGTANASGQSAINPSAASTGTSGGVASALGATTGTGTASSGTDPRLTQIGGIYQAGAHKLGAGALENLTPTELGLLKSGIEASGGDYDTFLTQYNRSRVGQDTGMSRAA